MEFRDRVQKLVVLYFNGLSILLLQILKQNANDTARIVGLRTENIEGKNQKSY